MVYRHFFHNRTETGKFVRISESGILMAISTRNSYVAIYDKVGGEWNQRTIQAWIPSSVQGDFQRGCGAIGICMVQAVEYSGTSEGVISKAHLFEVEPIFPLTD